MTAQEKRNQDLANTNAQLRKQLAKATEKEKQLTESQATVQTNLQSARAELESTRIGWEADKVEKVVLLVRLDTTAVEAILKTRVNLIEVYKVGKHITWDPDEEIDLFKTFLVEQAGSEEPDEQEDRDQTQPDGSSIVSRVGSGVDQSEPIVDDPEHVSLRYLGFIFILGAQCLGL